MTCEPDNNVRSCGRRCSPCPQPASGDGKAYCNAGICGITCDSGLGLLRKCSTVKEQRTCTPYCLTELQRRQHQQQQGACAGRRRRAGAGVNAR